MAQQTDPRLTEHERQLLEAVAAAYGLGTFSDPLASRDAWGGRIQIAFTAGHRLLLKEWPVYCHNDKTIDFALAVQDRARAGGVPSEVGFSGLAGCGCTSRHAGPTVFFLDKLADDDREVRPARVRRETAAECGSAPL